MRWATYRRLEQKFYHLKDLWELGAEQKIIGFLSKGGYFAHANDNKRPCAHCAINLALDEFFAENGPVDMDDVIDDVTAVLCELIAHWDDRNMRRLSVKQIVELIPKRVAAFRADGRYPGGSHPGMPPVISPARKILRRTSRPS